MTPHGQLAVRRPADVPLDSLLRLVRSCEELVTGVATCTREDILLEAGLPGYEDNSWCLTTPGGEVLGWAVLTPRGDTLQAGLTALPGRHGEQAARVLLCLLLDRADELEAQHGRSYAVSVGGVLGGDPVVPAVLQEAGFAPEAVTGQYDVDLTEPLLPLLLPEEAVLRGAGPGDTAELHALHLRALGAGPRTRDAAVFGASLDRLREIGGVAKVVEVSGQPAGYALAQGSPSEGRVLDVAVAPAFRGLGIGLALLTSVLGELRALGAVRALAGLDTGDLTDHRTLSRVLPVQGFRVVTRFHRTDG
ncbi:GNAT family N-acetyltransferase [Streptomyces solincola]|uniref:GNAT family N-acetyltransferase n=1 Tax=Streptomyces solincola TaxID=2100817 RepID=A0A2S9PZQ6_9ACTN|nr:GNAT family N-acetyltransferase [Streptomyces solincola]PRH79878.1 GNAT family N-acetyltransferase [Streptomyces solincola]